MTSAPDPLTPHRAALRAAVVAWAAAQRCLADAIAAERGIGTPWGEIAAELGTTQRAAHALWIASERAGGL